MSSKSSVETQKVAGAIASMGIDELIFNMAKGIADGQARLDQTCMDLAVQMGDAQIEFGKIPGTDEPDLISLVELGFTPNFYQFVDTILEINVSVTSQYEEEKETVTSDIDQQTDEKQTQTQYAHQRSNNYSGYGYGHNWGWGWGRWGYGGYGYGYSGGSSTAYKENTAQKSKTVKVHTVDASFASKYGYEVAAASVIKTKIVPIPPPQVLEEAVQNAAKERKEWAKRFALLRYSKNLLPAIATSGSKTNELINPFLELKDGDGAITQTKSAPSYSQVTDIKIGLESLNDEFTKLTNDHWSVIENVKDRRLLDNLFENLLKTLGKIMKNYDADKQARKSDIDADELNSDLQMCFDNLDSMQSKVDEIMERLPLTPEEQAEADQKKDDDVQDNPTT
ncbi:hypothetical protein [Ekhidna sp.]|uniref:hypothetical protein n=1 Tax=Ekhidna sp. TaxID=2608089 RepID=UPI003BABC479